MSKGRNICLCKVYNYDGSFELERCRANDVWRCVFGLIRNGNDEYCVDLPGTPDHLIYFVGKHKQTGMEDVFEVTEEELTEIYQGNEQVRKEIWREYLKWRRNYDLKAIYFVDPYVECCWGEKEICRELLSG